MIITFNYLIDCYENNDPHDVEANHSVNFHKLWQATIDCFSKYTNESIINDTTPNPDDNFEDQVKKLTTIFETTGSLCTNCSEVYNEMRKYFWNHVVPSNDKETIGGVCYDIRDAVSFRVANIFSEKDYLLIIISSSIILELFGKKTSIVSLNLQL